MNEPTRVQGIEVTSTEVLAMTKDERDLLTLLHEGTELY